MFSVRLLSWLLCLLFFSISTARAEITEEFIDANGDKRTAAQLEKHGFQSLFAGKTLDQWDVQPAHEGHWQVSEGIITYDGKSEQAKHYDKSLWTKQEFGDCLFYCEWRLPAEPKMKPHPIVLWNGDFLLDEQGSVPSAVETSLHSSLNRQSSLTLI